MPEPTRKKASRQRAPEPPDECALKADGHRRTRRAHAAETAEDYVELIADLIRAQGEARAIDLARHFDVTHVTINRTVARLQRDGFVVARPYRAIFLTPKGARLADRARRRHDVVLRFLLAMGVREATARNDAEGIEHHVSAATLKAMDAWTRISPARKLAPRHTPLTRSRR